MLFKTFILNSDISSATLTLYVHDEVSDPRPAVIVCPGGGYAFTSKREAAPIAELFYNAGINAYILDYSIGADAAEYKPLIEVATAIKYVRENASLHNTAPDKIITCGFSAGGHLAASSGILWNSQVVRDALGITDGSAVEKINRPNGMILSYPVITAGEFTHKGSVQNLSGRLDYSDDDVECFSLERHIDSTAPPMFIWHTANDTTVPVQNSLFLIEKYAEYKIPFEAHIYPFGPHGLSLATKSTWEGNPALDNPHVATWAGLAIEWIKVTFK